MEQNESVYMAIVQLVCTEFGIEPHDLHSKCRGRNLVRARQMLCFMAQQYTSLTLTAIGQRLNRDHTTVIHSLNTMNDAIKLYEGVRNRAHALDQELREMLTYIKNVDMQNPRLNFSYNWNNKLKCLSFSTLRLWNEDKYYKGRMVDTYLKGQYMFQAEIMHCSRVPYKNLTEPMAYIDTGYSLYELKDILRKMYWDKYKERGDDMALGFYILKRKISMQSALPFSTTNNNENNEQNGQ